MKNIRLSLIKEFLAWAILTSVLIFFVGLFSYNDERNSQDEETQVADRKVHKILCGRVLETVLEYKSFKNKNKDFEISIYYNGDFLIDKCEYTIYALKKDWETKVAYGPTKIKDVIDIEFYLKKEVGQRFFVGLQLVPL